ncbi:MAG: tRNA pseudouridine(38-40) synthase TruA [Bacteroidales bacterium]
MRYFLIFSYNGAAYHGWQIQPNCISVQKVMEEALEKILRVKTPLTAAGRTDTGVHARYMAAHFDTGEPISDKIEFLKRLNSILPSDIAIEKVLRVNDDAHARFDALYRTYHYYITDTKNPFGGQYSCRYYGDMDFTAMNAAALCLKNYTDFTSFSKLHTNTVTNNCKIYVAYWERYDNDWRFVIKADRFLRNMVRAVVGTLLQVGRGKLTVDGFCEVIEAKDRCRAGTSVPANALFLVDVGYPEDFFNCS